MNREIKFRFWNGKKMVHGPTDSNQNASWVLACAPIYDAPLMQFTGLKDNLGKEVYEGDIISFYKKSSDSHIWGKVFWTPLYMTWLVKYKTCPTDYASEYLSEIQNSQIQFIVIGNIHEHTQLLKELPE